MLVSAMRVNGQIIPPEAVEHELNRLVKFYSAHLSSTELQRQMPALQAKAREQAVGARLLLEESARLDLRVPAADIQEKLNELIVQCGGRQTFERLLDEQQTSEATIRTGIEQGRRVDLLVARVTQGVADPTEADLRAHFEAHREEYARPERAALAHILIRFEPGQTAERATARSRLETLRRELEAGADFAALASLHSECPSGRENGGHLGWVSRGMMVPPFEQAGFALEVGQLSEVVETPFGLHLIRKTDHQAGGPAEYDDVRENIRDFLRHVARGRAVSAYVDELRAKAVIEMT